MFRSLWSKHMELHGEPFHVSGLLRKRQSEPPGLWHAVCTGGRVPDGTNPPPKTSTTPPIRSRSLTGHMHAWHESGGDATQQRDRKLKRLRLPRQPCPLPDLSSLGNVLGRGTEYGRGACRSATVSSQARPIHPDKDPTDYNAHDGALDIKGSRSVEVLRLTRIVVLDGARHGMDNIRRRHQRQFWNG